MNQIKRNPLNVAFQADPIETMDVANDTTFRLMEEARDRGHDVFHYMPDQLRYQNGRVEALGSFVSVDREKTDLFTADPQQLIDLRSMDVVWLRQDPPFDMSYVTTTHLLELVSGSTLVVNDPKWVRNFPEKLLVLRFPDLTPPTLITRDTGSIRSFREEYGDIVVKPLFGNGGAGVFHLTPEDPNLGSLCEMFLDASREPLIIQKYLPEVSEGDKRIFIIGGEPAGAINRIPAEGEARSNLHVGGIAAPADLKDRDREICATIGPMLREHGQVFVGIDVIGGWLTEINLTSPTGIPQLEQFEETNAAALIWDTVEAQLAG